MISATSLWDTCSPGDRWGTRKPSLLQHPRSGALKCFDSKYVRVKCAKGDLCPRAAAATCEHPKSWKSPCEIGDGRLVENTRAVLVNLVRCTGTHVETMTRRPARWTQRKEMFIKKRPSGPVEQFLTDTSGGYCCSKHSI